MVRVCLFLFQVTDFVMENRLRCSLCSAASHLNFNVKGYVQHIKFFHAHCANFEVVCGIGRCQRCFTNVGTFLNHVYAIHGSADQSTTSNRCTITSAENVCQSNDESSDDFDSSNHHVNDDNEPLDLHQPSFSQSTLLNCLATFLLGIKEKYKLT